MSYFIWVLAVGLAGWVSGKIVGCKGFGRVADILFGLAGAFLVRSVIERVGVPLGFPYLLLFSILGAAAPPAMARLLLRDHIHSKAESSRTPAKLESSDLPNNWPASIAAPAGPATTLPLSRTSETDTGQTSGSTSRPAA
jgi:uncharacterized membrane protein YeaQ/YmgE (transglycosylase-associated protein family)